MSEHGNHENFSAFFLPVLYPAAFLFKSVKTGIERRSRTREYIDARLADAHELVKELKGPFDFVFSDADKQWYKNYFIDIDPKLIVGGCFTAHNIYQEGKGFESGQKAFFEYIKSLKNYETTLNSTGEGVSISYKKAAK